MPYFGTLAPFIFYYFCSMQIIPVTTPILAKQFLQVAININKNDTHWIQPLNKDINDVFNKEKNKFEFLKSAIKYTKPKEILSWKK